MNLFYEISTGAPNAPSIFYQRVREAAARLSRDCVFEAVKVMLSALGAFHQTRRAERYKIRHP
jgi:hypothetical protein